MPAQHDFKLPSMRNLFGHQMLAADPGAVDHTDTNMNYHGMTPHEQKHEVAKNLQQIQVESADTSSPQLLS